MNWSHSDIDIEIRYLYESNRPLPLIDWLDQWKAGRIDASTAVVIQLVCGYRNMVNRRGARAADARPLTAADWLDPDNIKHLTTPR